MNDFAKYNLGLNIYKYVKTNLTKSRIYIFLILIYQWKNLNLFKLYSKYRQQNKLIHSFNVEVLIRVIRSISNLVFQVGSKSNLVSVWFYMIVNTFLKIGSNWKYILIWYNYKDLIWFVSIQRLLISIYYKSKGKLSKSTL